MILFSVDVLSELLPAAWEYGGMIDSTPDFIKKVDLYMPLLE